MIKRIKELFATAKLAWHNATHIERMLESRDMEIRRLRERCNKTESIIRDSVSIDVDVAMSHKDPCVIIMSGRIGRREIVQTFSMHVESFEEIHRILQNMKRYGRIRNIDAPPNMRGFFDMRPGWER